MAAIDLGIRWKGSQAGQRGFHLGGIAFEEPTTSAGEQRIAGEHTPRDGEVIRDMSAGMSWDADDATDEAADLDGITVVDAVCDARNPWCVGDGTEHLQIWNRRQQILIPADVVEVMVGGEDGSQTDAVALHFRQDGFRLRAVDDASVLRSGVNDEVRVVVRELRDGDDAHGVG